LSKRKVSFESVSERPRETIFGCAIFALGFMFMLAAPFVLASEFKHLF